MRDPDLTPILLPSPRTGCEETLLSTPRLARNANGTMTISVAYVDAQGRPETSMSDPPQTVVEVVTLKRRGWVIVDADLDVFLMTEAEYNAQLGGL